MDSKKTYIAIDLKSFYASVECVARGLDPLTTNLLVADVSKTEKTICLAVTPSLKAHGISGRARLFEAVQQVKMANAKRKALLRGKDFTGVSYDDTELKKTPSLAIDYIAAPPRMALYRECSTKIVATYLKYVSMDDLYPYSIDEVFIDATSYLSTYKMSAHDFAAMLIKDVLNTYGVTATAGIAENRLRRSGVTVYSLPESLLKVGVMKMQTPHGHLVPVYDMERTVCDLVHDLDPSQAELLQNVLNRYAVKDNKRIGKLMQYAEIFRIDKEIRYYLMELYRKGKAKI